MSSKLSIPSVPHLVHIETTYKCNCSCIFCYNPRRGERFNGAMIDRIVNSVYESWVPHVYLIGGEPSLLGVKRLNKYIEFLSERSSVTIVTNGLRCLNGLSIKLACIGVPIHGDEKTHERHTQAIGGYKKTIATIRYYVSRGFDVRCIPVLTSWNFDQMRDIIALAKDLGMESVFVDRFEDGGLGSCRAKDLKPSLDQFRVALGQMIEARDSFGMPVGFGTAIPYCLDPRLISQNMFTNCGVGTTFAAINPYGDVRICNQSEIVYGNVLAEPIQKIWAKKELDEFRDLRWVTEPCRSCPVLKDCVCGCKVDCNCSKGFCVDYAVRGLPKPPNAVFVSPGCEPSGEYPKTMRVLVVEPHTKLNLFHKEKYLVTRYQTIELDEMAVEILQAIMSGETREASLVTRFSDLVEESDVRSFVTRLGFAKAIRFV